MASAGESKAIPEVSRPPAASAAMKARGVLFIVENLPSPFDRRVWQEATSLAAAGYEVSIICPTGKGYEAREEVIDGTVSTSAMVSRGSFAHLTFEITPGVNDEV